MDEQLIEIIAHAACPFLESNGDEPCMKCSIGERGPSGGVRGCMHDGGKLARSILTALEANGYVVVPVEPTPAMLAAVRWDDDDARDGYQCMLAARPSPKEGQA